MTTELAQKPRQRRRAPGRIGVFSTRVVLFWEALWPAALPVLVAPFAIIVFSLFDVWRYTPQWLHWLTLLLAVAVTGLAGWRYLREVRWPSKRLAQQRLEEDGRVAHAPLQALDDKPFDEDTASPLWRAHLAKSADRARQARFGGMRPTIDARDPFAVRFWAVGLLLMAIVAAGDDWRMRLGSALMPGAAIAGNGLVADLWIEPPDYTGKPPIYLARAGTPLAGVAAQTDVPAGAELVAQINGAGRMRLRFISSDTETDIPLERTAGAARARTPLMESGVAQLRLGGREQSWPLAVIEDAPPTAEFITPPAATEENLVSIVVAVNDDYGVAKSELHLRLKPDQERPLDAPALDPAALNETRIIQLEGVAGVGNRRMDLDLQEDPWAGLVVIAKAVAIDGAGQEGETESVELQLPTRRFFNPLARAVIEQRQTLAVSAEDWRRAGRSFDALTLAPEFFYEDLTDYLLLRTAFWRIMRQTQDGFDDAVEKFWPLALQLEDEALELARQRLEAAQEALRQALENGASDAEISRLVEELRQAMNDYLTALAQSGETAPNTAGGDAERFEQSDLDQMLDSIRDLAEQGAANAARQMLSDLSNLLNNLRLSQGGQGSGSGQGQGGDRQGGAAGAAGELIGRQRELADETFQRGRMPGESGDDLAAEEQGLGGDLDQLIDELSGDGAGADPNGDAKRALGRARNDMRQAEQALRNGDFEGASGAMERAIGNLRDGAEDLAREQMRQAQQNGGGQGQGGEGMNDPLGRPSGYAEGDGVEVPGESPAARTRAVIEELRRRLGEQGRSEAEVEYLERLLERF